MEGEYHKWGRGTNPPPGYYWSFCDDLAADIPFWYIYRRGPNSKSVVKTVYGPIPAPDTAKHKAATANAWGEG